MAASPNLCQGSDLLSLMDIEPMSTPPSGGGGDGDDVSPSFSRMLDSFSPGVEFCQMTALLGSLT